MKNELEVKELGLEELNFSQMNELNGGCPLCVWYYVKDFSVGFVDGFFA